MSPIVEVSDLVFEYPGHRALNGVSFTIEAGSVTALVGPNGAGKTTLLRCLAALETPFSGSVRIAGFDTIEFPRSVHASLGYLSDFYGLYNDLTVGQCLTYAAWSHGADSHAVQEAAASVELLEYLDRPSGTLSRGLKQRLAIGQAIVHRPKLLLLDEPAAGLDPEARLSLSHLILKLQSQGIMLLVSSHILAELEDYSSAMLTISDGKILGHETLRHSTTQSRTTSVIDIEFAEPVPNLRSELQSLEGLVVLADSERCASIEVTSAQRARVLRDLVTKKQLPVTQFTERTRAMQDVYLEQIRKSRGEQ